MKLLSFLVDFILHIDVHLGQIISAYGFLTYAVLFAVIFIETGLVFMPFLPGDSLLFAAGAFAALGSLNIWLLWILLVLAAVLGDTANYWIGHFFGQQLIDNPRVPIKAAHIEETNKFFEKHGGKTIIMARFVPIVRTFAPFVAGIGKMSYKKFISYNLIGGLAWVTIALFAGFFFGNIPYVKENFSLIILLIIIISVVPMLVPVISNKLKKK